MKLISVTEAAALAGIDARHVRRLLEAGTIAGQKVGGRWVVDASRLAKFSKHPTRGRPKANGDSDLEQS